MAYAVTRNPAHAAATGLPPGIPLRITGIPARALFTSWRTSPQPRIDRWTGPVDVVHGTNFVVPPTRAAASSPCTTSRSSRPGSCVGRLAAVHRFVAGRHRRGATVHVFSDTVADEVRAAVSCPRIGSCGSTPGLRAGAARRTPRRRTALAGAGRYVLALGTVDPRKNLPRLVEASTASPTMTATCVSSWPAPMAGAPRPSPPPSMPRAIATGSPGSDTSTTMSAGTCSPASVLAYPSLDEGFGHPRWKPCAPVFPSSRRAPGALPECWATPPCSSTPPRWAALAAALTASSPIRQLRRGSPLPGRARGPLLLDAPTDELVELYRRASRSPARSRHYTIWRSSQPSSEATARGSWRSSWPGAAHEEILPAAPRRRRVDGPLRDHRAVRRSHQHQQRAGRDPPGCRQGVDPGYFTAPCAHRRGNPGVRTMPTRRANSSRRAGSRPSRAV